MELKAVVIKEFATLTLELCLKACRTVQNKMQPYSEAQGSTFEHFT